MHTPRSSDCMEFGPPSLPWTRQLFASTGSPFRSSRCGPRRPAAAQAEIVAVAHGRASVVSAERPLVAPEAFGVASVKSVRLRAQALTATK